MKLIAEMILLLVSSPTNLLIVRRTTKNTLLTMQPVSGFSSTICISSRRPSRDVKSFRMASDDVSLDTLWERRNESRKKFGMKPLSRDEFIVLQEETRMQAEKRRLEFRNLKPQQRRSESPNMASILETMLSAAAPQVCETNDDCPAPSEVCCDFRFQKVCCSHGVKEAQQQPALIPVPVKLSHLA